MTDLATPIVDATPGVLTASPVSPPGSAVVPHPISSASPEDFAILRVLADSFQDVQDARIAVKNRTSAKRLKDGTVVPAAIPAELVADVLDALMAAEKKASSLMQKAFRRAAPEVHAWARTTPGIGVSSDRLIARLLGAIGHPVMASPYHWEGEGPERVLVADSPYLRSVSQLWSYCGHGDPARRRRRGMSPEDALALGNPRAKMLVHLLAEACMKCVGGGTEMLPIPSSAAPAPDTDFAGDPDPLTEPDVRAPRRRSPYRDVYDLRRLETADREGWTDGHRHADALRIVGKAILRDLWLVAQAESAHRLSPSTPSTPIDRAKESA